MSFPPEQIDALRRYCEGISTFTEANVEYLRLANLRLPEGCNPLVCDALLCPTEKKLYFSVTVKSAYTRNWNVSNKRVGEVNWVAFSWNINLGNPSLLDIVLSHLSGFVREK